MPADHWTAVQPGELLPDPLPGDPLPIVAAWLGEAARLKVQPNPNAMALATADAAGRPAARIVLCKSLVADPGYLVFYTSYASRKGREIAMNPRASAVLHWDALGRQVRIEGPVLRSPIAESDAYFRSRSIQSRLSAVASAQSEPIDSRERLLERARRKAAELGIELRRDDDGQIVARPMHWGGYRLWAERVELWVAAPARLHDRACWSRPLAPDAAGGFRPGPWSATRLQP